MVYCVFKLGGVMFVFELGVGYSVSLGVKYVVEMYGVYEKDMLLVYVWKLGKCVGFWWKLFLLLLYEVGKVVYWWDFLKIVEVVGDGNGLKLWFEKMWGYFCVVMKVVKMGCLGLIVMWK